MTGAPLKHVLVIRHGALGDIILSFPAFAAIRDAHPEATITILTTRPFAPLLARAPWFDRIAIDAKPAAWNLQGLLALRRQLAGFDMVYDLQTSGRSSRYFRLAGSPPWSGIAPGCRYPHTNPSRDSMHTRDRIAEQLAMAGIDALPIPNLAWMQGDVVSLDLPDDFTALVPGAAPHRPAKRWPAERFGTLAASLPDPVLILGTTGESPIAAEIRRHAPHAIDLTGRTDFFTLAGVLARAARAIGNDTGPMHLAAAIGIPSLVLFGPDSDPALTAPRHPDGAWPAILHAPDLASLDVARVEAALP